MPLPPPGRTLRTVGFDDAPFTKRRSASVPVAGVVCADTRFEGLLWGSIRCDGWNAAAAIIRLLEGGKFLPQIHALLFDGITLGGLNIVDLALLSHELRRPCIAVMRRAPDLAAMEVALRHLPRPEERLALIARAGPIHHRPPFFFQVQGADPDSAFQALRRVTDRGYVPEPLRLAHLVGAAVVHGESGRRA